MKAVEFVAALHEANYKGPLVIERESGNNRLIDIQSAIEALRKAAEGEQVAA